MRSLIYLKQADAGDGRELQFLKNNYGPLGNSVPICWRNGVFIPVPAAGTLEVRAHEYNTEQVFLTLLTRFAAENRNVTDKPGTTYAPKMFVLEPEATGVNKAVLEGAMRRLLRAGKIKVLTEGPPSRRRSRLVLGDLQ